MALFSNGPYLPRYGCRGDLMLETLFTGLENWFNKLETLVHQVKTKTAAVFMLQQEASIPSLVGL